MFHKIKSALFLVNCFVLTSCGGGGSNGGDSFPPVAFKLESVVSDASFPVSLAQAPDGRLFYTELTTGNIRVVSNGVLNPSPVVSVGVPGAGNEGLLGLALDPEFARNGFLYTYYTARNPTRNRVVRFTVVGDTANDPAVLIDNLPFGGHDGGRLVFGIDGTLFISVGDGGVPQSAQSSDSYGGKILRINRDGTTPRDNPDSASPIFASGLRNAFGLSIDPRNGALYASDNGPTCDDELNQVPAGGNLGWRENQPCGDTDPRFIQPLMRFNPPVAPTGITFYTGDKFPALRNNILMADYIRGGLTRFEVDEESGTILNEAPLINGELGSLIDVSVGIDGYIYVASSTAIQRLVPN